jgi:hypothetical protein
LAYETTKLVDAPGERHLRQTLREIALAQTDDLDRDLQKRQLSLPAQLFLGPPVLV